MLNSEKGNATTEADKMQNAQIESNTANLQRMLQQQNELSGKNAVQSDSLAKDNTIGQEKNNKAVLTAREDYTTEPARMQNAGMQSNAKDLQSMKERQDELYRQYADQSARLENDIARLNTRLSTTRQYEPRNRVSYIPLPIPFNNSGSKSNTPVEAAPLKIKDTVYVRDTVTILKKDTINHIRMDTISLIPEATTKQTVIKETKPDTIVVKESVKQPGFNYAEMPEDNILFGIGKSTVQPIYENRLNFIADVLKKDPDLQVIVTGHTDATGSKAINEKLSLQRAEAVSYYLLNKGVAKKQITIKSLSSEEPAVAGGTQAAHSQNRRVALKLTKLNE